MHHLVTWALRAALVVVGLGTLAVQGLILPLAALDMSRGDDDVAFDELDLTARAVLALALLLGVVVCVQVVLVCTWRLLTMVRRGTVFSHAAFRFVDVTAGAIAVAAALVFGIACALAPGEDVAPGVVLLVCLASAATGGVALLVWVLRSLLAQAVARDAEARELQAELSEVI